MKNAFPEKLKTVMQDLNTEFTLKKISDKEYDLHRIHSKKTVIKRLAEQSGSSFDFEHKGASQPLNFILNTENSDISNLSFKIDNKKSTPIGLSLKSGEILKYTGGDKATVYDKNWNIIKEININPEYLKIKSGKHKITFNCDFDNGKEVKLEVRTQGEGERVNLER